MITDELLAISLNKMNIKEPIECWLFPAVTVAEVLVAVNWTNLSILGRKVMTNLDSILKSRDITLPTKVHLVKAMVFPVVMYGCESWTMKKAECQKIDAFELGVEDS